jgi:hypothetical protein
MHDVGRTKVARLTLVEPRRILVRLHVCISVCLIRKTHDGNKRGLAVTSTNADRYRGTLSTMLHNTVGALVNLTAHTNLVKGLAIEIITANNTGTHK